MTVSRPGLADSTTRRTITTLVVAIASLSAVPSAQAHQGTVHAGVPHFVLLTLFLLGAAILGVVVVLDRTSTGLSTRAAGLAVAAGTVLTALGAVGLVEIQVEPITSTPLPRTFYPALTFFAGMAIATASVVLYNTRWGDHHAYPLLGAVLGFWVAYPELVPHGTVFHPLGYALVLALPVVLGYVVWTEVWPAIGATDRRARLVGSLAGLGFAVFFAVSSGLLSVNPDQVPQAGGESFVVVTEFASPLVMWPAVEAYWPSVPLFTALSVGTALILTILAGLVGLNATLGAAVWLARDDADPEPTHESESAATDGGVTPTDTAASSSVRGVAGTIATTGATACCCCAPAFYGIASAAFGASASPLYWAFTDPDSPLATVFLVGAIALLTASVLSLATNVRDTCVGVDN
ncbi:hypothetical protein [Haloarchaeobius sp. DFWS5]|uniref:hypothetical protein n=1 Tax=Haloarchaeobius sp. DFWS5 TaxID=3446114 RepID=UPI003EBD4965